uniref:TauD/TfdA family dioxygenase n=1 Tax=Roseivirga sp. TaxID=1964215 RepID=UPI0040489576
YDSPPEEYFGLLTLKKASCGGGESYLLSLNNILRELRALPNGMQIEHVLKSSQYPFIVPNVFKQTQDEKEYNFGSILGLNEIRFRVDTLEKALKERPDLCTKDQAQAYYQLKDIIINSPSIKRFFLEDGDLLLVNNKTMLHGRSQFSDPNRHLLRIRFNARRTI